MPFRGYLTSSILPKLESLPMCCLPPYILMRPGIPISCWKIQREFPCYCLLSKICRPRKVDLLCNKSGVLLTTEVSISNTYDVQLAISPNRVYPVFRFVSYLSPSLTSDIRRSTH